ncbi:MAG: choice-of-anchor Y domain-containing protein [Planctomycetota bacterium]|jgi:hypothetical protein
MKKRCVCVLVMAVAVQLVACASVVQAVVLYDGSLGAGDQTPSGQGWWYLTDPISGALATQSASGGITTLDTTPVISESAGYFSTPLMLTLDRSGDGYTVRFDTRIVSETHNNDDRAGFSVLALSSDLKGVEIAFWPNEIWAQLDAPLFTHGEGATFDTTAGLVQYDLAINGDSYALYADGSMTLQGALRDYSAHSHPVYSMPNILFFGDDSSSAAGVSQLAYIEVLDSAVPEPSTILLLALGGALLSRRRRT